MSRTKPRNQYEFPRRFVDGTGSGAVSAMLRMHFNYLIGLRTDSVTEC
jgi:hypothetical protein